MSAVGPKQNHGFDDPTDPELGLSSVKDLIAFFGQLGNCLLYKIKGLGDKVKMVILISTR